MFTVKASTVALAAALFTGVRAHGNVDSMVIGGQDVTGYLPYQDPYKNPVPARSMRNIPGNGPIEDVTSIDIQCNTGAKPAALISPMNAGEEIAFHWTDWPDSHKGPVITYMAKAPEGTNITEWSPTGDDKVWFKIDEAGLEDGKWAATDILTGEKNSVWTVTVPSSLEPGDYLVRHEIIALHSAGTYPGAQFYPSCTQVSVGGSGTDAPDAASLVAFPGAYTGAEPGITFNLYNNPTSYTIPGPAVWPSGSGSGSTPAPSGGASSAAPAASSAAASAPAASAAPASSAPAASAPAASASAAVSAPAASAPAVTSAAAPAPSASATLPPCPSTKKAKRSKRNHKKRLASEKRGSFVEPLSAKRAETRMRAARK